MLGSSQTPLEVVPELFLLPDTHHRRPIDASVGKTRKGHKKYVKFIH